MCIPLPPVLALAGRRFWFFLALSLVLLAGFPGTGAGAVPARSANRPCKEWQHGTASWHGGCGTTANGRRWHCSELVAAHRSLPLGTQVRVTNMKNGRQTIVRIADRGPYTRGRVIDLSPAAARQIDMLETGVAQVRIELFPQG